MGRSPCCDKVGLKKGPWTPEEDHKLLAYIEEHGHGSWRALPAKAGLQRCGKSCRLRWTNYLRPDIKRGKFSLQEEQTIIQLHALLGNRWSAIATHLPKRTDNEIKNYWNTHLKKRLTKMGIDPVTHKPKNDALVSSDGQSKTAANLSHMAQWESARLEAEARLVRESKLRSHLAISSTPSPSTSVAPIINSNNNNNNNNKSEAAPPPLPPPPRSLNVFKGGWNGGGWLNSNEEDTNNNNGGIVINGMMSGDHLDSPTSTLSFSENNPPPPPPILGGGGGGIVGQNTTTTVSNNIIEFVGVSDSNNNNNNSVKEECDEQDHQWKGYDDDEEEDDEESSMANFTSGFHDLTMTMEGAWETAVAGGDGGGGGGGSHDEGFTSLLLNAQSDNDRSLSSEGGGESNNNGAGHDHIGGSAGGCCGGGGCGGGGGNDFYEDNKNYWNSILNLVNSSPSDSPMF